MIYTLLVVFSSVLEQFCVVVVGRDGKINAMRKIKEMSGNNAMLRRRGGGRPIVDTPPLRMVPGRESGQKTNT